MFRFLLTPKWIAGHVLLLVAVVLFVNLGLWQLGRLDERRAFNDRVTAQLAAAPVPLDAALDGGPDDPAALDHRPVTVEGRYVDGAQVLTAPRARDGRPGPHVLTVLATDDGRQVLVDRGWIPFSRDAVAPEPVDGPVRVSGLLRVGEPGAIGEAEQVARIAPAAIGERLDRPLPDVYVQLADQQPRGDVAPLPTPPPALDEGPHLSYALQWFSFAAIALIGYPILVVRTARDRRDRPPDASVAQEAPDRITVR